MDDGPENLTDSVDLFFGRGWLRFGFEETLASWVRQVHPAARAVATAPDHAHWLRCGGTWFVGVNALPNDAAGRLGAGPPLTGHAVSFIHRHLQLGEFAWDRGQVSICYPGYPRKMPGESDGSFSYRCQRDAAHVDGLLPEGPQRRRHLREYHAFILGIPLSEHGAAAAPLVVWEGSHEIVREQLHVRLDALPPEQWGDEDITAAYHRAREDVFASCRRVEISSRPGEAYLVHRLAVHGMAPWPESLDGEGDAREICYFRPEVGGPADWLNRV